MSCTDTAALRLLNVNEAADRLGVSVSYLNKLRLSGRGPAFMKLGARRVAYDPADLAAWLNECRRTSTGAGEPGGAA
jgi:predicted DNA-binding transcriptional regulator AlpA